MLGSLEEAPSAPQPAPAWCSKNRESAGLQRRETHRPIRRILEWQYAWNLSIKIIHEIITPLLTCLTVSTILASLAVPSPEASRQKEREYVNVSIRHGSRPQDVL